MHRNTAFLHRHWRAKDSLVGSKDYSKQLFQFQQNLIDAHNV